MESKKCNLFFLIKQFVFQTHQGLNSQGFDESDVDLQWSLEQISARLKHEKSEIKVSSTTIYRTIYNGVFELERLNHGKRGLIRSLRHKGKTRHSKGYQEKREKIPISHTIHERPESANQRLEIGRWEADTVLENLEDPV